ncbi:MULTISPECIES: YcjF family protein [Enterococcus]|uniref:YcjF family protein n=1 Tax=Enterococcus TaxID=1350 RepID=UPI000A35A7F0|nr:YcjF family protein [Enterococcus sp. 3G6_DIV0642]NKD32958.1 YcjF family protein [Enterococcus casseliflavus]
MNNESKEGDISLKKPWIKRKKKQHENELLTEQSVQVEQSQTREELQEEAEFTSFFADVMNRMPKKSAALVMKGYDGSKAQAEKVLAKSKDQFDQVFEEFLVGVDDETRKKAHRTIHAASLTAAIIGCSPIPFSDAVLLVPVQMTMMARLYRIFGRTWREGLAKSISKELVVVSFGRSAVGNILKFVPAVGTVAGAAINASVASGITEALGWVTVKMLNDGEDVFEQVMSFKGQFHTLFNALKVGKKSK